MVQQTLGITYNYATNIIGISGIEARKQDGITGFFAKDAHGDVRQAYTSTGTLLADYTYNAWGDKQSASTLAWAQNNPVRYNGQYLDEESGMYYLRARYYDPQLCRFITEDPHWTVDNMIYGDGGNIIPNSKAIYQSINLYIYCLNNPVKYTDILGHKIEDDDNEAFDNDLLTVEQINAIRILTTKYEDAEAIKNYKGMNDARAEVVEIRRIYNPQYIDNYDYTHGGKTDISGKVIVVKAESSKNNSKINATKSKGIDIGGGSDTDGSRSGGFIRIPDIELPNFSGNSEPSMPTPSPTPSAGGNYMDSYLKNDEENIKTDFEKGVK